MKTIPSLRKHHYLRSIGVLLIVVALVAVTASCGGGTAPTYDLTMAVSPTDGGTATDVTGGSPYEEGTDVDIRATPAEGYEFVTWSAPASWAPTAPPRSTRRPGRPSPARRSTPAGQTSGLRPRRRCRCWTCCRTV